MKESAIAEAMRAVLRHPGMNYRAGSQATHAGGTRIHPSTSPASLNRYSP